MKKKQILRAVLLVLILILTQNASFAAPVQWRVEDGGNGHWYDAINYSANWIDAKTHAQNQFWNSIQGHLATMTSAAEYNFLWSHFPYTQYWLGGYQIDKTAEPSGNWAWITGEPWNYNNWATGEPNDWGGEEEYAVTWYEDGTWNDATNRYPRSGYFIEYEPVNNGLIAYYPFNGNANDESGNGLDGAVSGAILTNDRFDNSASAYIFDGVNNNIIILPDSGIRSLLNGASAFTAIAWVYNNGPGDPYRNILRICDTGPDSRGLMFRIGASNFPDSNHNKLEVLLGTTDYQTQHVASLTEIPLNTWTHLALVYGGSKIWIYINGVTPDSVERRGIPGGDGVIPNGVPQTGTVTMGNSPAYISAYNTENFNGKIDEVRLYNRALSGDEIHKLAMGGDINNAYQDCKRQLSACCNPTAISLSSIQANPSDKKIILKWQTETESNNAGFNVWRADNFVKVNDSMIPASGSSVSGSEYDFVDEWVLNGKRYFYLLEDIDTNGISTFHGPIKAVPRWWLGVVK